MTDEMHKEKYGSELNNHHIRKARKFGNDHESKNALDNMVTLCNTHHKKYEHLPNERAKKLIGAE